MKECSRDLAVFGASPAFEEKLHVGRPNIGDRKRLLERFNEVLDRQWLTNEGPLAQEFEQRLADFLGVKHCIAICNGTVALEIAIRAMELRGEVVIPSFTFVATAHALQWQEITPVFCDIDPKTHNLDPYSVEKMITPRTTGIIGVHVWGRPCDVEALQEIAQRRKLKLLFDAAHAFGCSTGGRFIGGFGDAEVFSFHATKFFNSLEGGAIATNNDELAAKVRLMKNFGFSGYDKVTYIGTNGKMNEMCAAMGLTSLESIDQFIAVNRNNYYAYRDGLAGIPGVSVMAYNESERCNYQYLVLEIDEALTGLSRDQLMHVLWSENVLARRYFYPGCHHMEPYKSYFPHANLLLPATERLAQRVLLLPTGTSVKEKGIDSICQVIRLAVANSREVEQQILRSSP